MSWIENKVKSLGMKFVVKEVENLAKITEANPKSIDDPINDFLIAQVTGIKWSSMLIVIFSKMLKFFMKKK